MARESRVYVSLSPPSLTIRERRLPQEQLARWLLGFATITLPPTPAPACFGSQGGFFLQRISSLPF